MNRQLLIELQDRVKRIELAEESDEADSAEQIANELVDHAAAVAGFESPEYGLALRVRASLYRKHGDTERATKDYSSALPLVLKGGDELLVQSGETLISLTGLYQQLNQWEKAEDASRSAIHLIGEASKTETGIVAGLARKLATQRLSLSMQHALEVFDQLIAMPAAMPGMRLAFLLERAAFEGENGNPAAPETFARAWALARSDSPSVGFPLPGQWTQLGMLAVAGAKTTEALEAAAQLRNWPRLDDLRQYLEIVSSGLRLEAIATVAAAADPIESEAALRHWLEFSIASFGLDTEQVADAQVRFGRFLINQKRADEAVPMLRRATLVRSNLPNRPDLALGEAYFELALALDKSGHDTEAMTNYGAAHNLYANALGPAHPNSIQAALNLAEVARVAHDQETAEFWFRYALRSAGEPQGNRTDHIALGLNNLAETLLATDRADEAAPLAEKGLAIRLDLFGVESNEYARSLGVVAEIALKRGDLTRFDAAIEDFESRSQDNKLALPAELAIGYLELQGEHQQAIDLCERALKVLESSGPTDDSLMPGQRITLRLQLGRLYALLQNWPEARRQMFEAFRIETVFLSDEAGRRSHRQMQQLMAESRSRLGALLDVMVVDPTVAADDLKSAYEILQQRRAMETRLLAFQKLSFVGDRALTSISPEHLAEVRQQVSALVIELSTAREAWLAALLRYQQIPGNDPEGLNVRSHQEYAESLERSLASYVGEGSRDFALMGITSSMPVLQPAEAVVEYFLAEKPTAVYYAFVVAGGQVYLAPLGDAASIHLALSQMRSQAISAPPADDPDPVWRRRGRFLFNRLLKPLLPCLDGVTRIYFVPDAELYTLPFDLLPIDDRQLAIDRWTITHLWSGGEHAGFNFTLGSPAAPASPVVISAPLLGDEIPAQAVRFAELPSAATEGETIAQKLGAIHLQGPQATKAAVVALQRPEILHLATHSFYVPRGIAGELSNADLQDTLLFRTRAPLSDPMYRCGVALTAANRELSEPSAASPGILFASDVIDLDLRDTDMVVLSSCQSGLGDSRPGDGIQGLRRAFRVAGVKTVISSLWKVPDEATLQFMVELYDRLLAKMPRGQALQESKLALRQRYGNRPLYWAGFVLDGLDHPLFRFSAMRGFKIANFSGTPFTYSQGVQEMEKQHWEKALKLFESVLYSRTAEDELRSKAAFHRASIFRRTGRLPQALEAYDTLISNLQTPAETRKWAIPDRALTKMMLGDSQGAFLDYTAALADADLSPDYRAQLLVNRGAALSNLDDDASAIADWSNVVKLPGAPPDQVIMALQNRADLRRRSGDYPGAIADANAVLAMPEPKGTPQRENTLLIVALCYADVGNLQKAKSSVRLHLQERKSFVPRGAKKELAACSTPAALIEFIGKLIQSPQ